MSGPDISPAFHAKLFTCQLTLTSVERLCSMLKSMIRENRNFTDVNVAFYYEVVIQGLITLLVVRCTSEIFLLIFE